MYQELSQLIAKKSQKHSQIHLETDHIKSFPERLMKVLFPQRQNYHILAENEIEDQLSQLANELCSILEKIQLIQANSSIDCREKACSLFFENLPQVVEHLYLDAEAIYREDPAAESIDEVILCYPGFFAIATYRFAHLLHQQKVPLLPRIFSEYAHEKTGIDIHPKATIGQSFCIDHGTGIVIGETTTIGNHVKIYQGVTLGSLSVKKSLASTKRHPTIEDNVVVYSNTTILGGDTTIGKNSVIGGNCWIVQSVPADSKISKS